MLSGFRFQFQQTGDTLPHEAFGDLLNDLVAAHRAGFPILHTQVYYPDACDDGETPPDAFMIEVLNEESLESLLRFLRSRVNVDQTTILPFDPVDAVRPDQNGMWCYSSHAVVLRIAPPDR